MKTVNKILILSLIFFAILYTVCRLGYIPSFATALAAGYVAGVANFFSLGKKIEGMFNGSAGKALVFNSQLRLIGTGVYFWFLMVELKMNIIGMLVGFSILPVCIPVFVIYNNVKGKEEDGTPT
jgi:hypothetical protein